MTRMRACWKQLSTTPFALFIAFLLWATGQLHRGMGLFRFEILSLITARPTPPLLFPSQNSVIHEARKLARDCKLL